MIDLKEILNSKLKPIDMSMLGCNLFGPIVARSHLDSLGRFHDFFSGWPTKVSLPVRAPVDTGQLRPSMRIVRTEMIHCFGRTSK